MLSSRAAALAGYLLSLATASTDSVAAQPSHPPFYNDRLWCNITSHFEGGPYTIPSCEWDELRARRRLATNWEKWPEKLKDDCEAKKLAHSTELLVCVLTNGKNGELNPHIHDVEVDCHELADQPVGKLNHSGSRKGISDDPNNRGARAARFKACSDTEMAGYDYIQQNLMDIPVEILAQCLPMNQAPVYRRLAAWADCIRPLYETYRKHPAKDAVTLSTR